MVDFDEMYKRYVKVEDTIKSCTSIYHVKVAKQMVVNFYAWCLSSDLSTEAIDLYTNHLLDHLHEKSSEFTKEKDS